MAGTSPSTCAKLTVMSRFTPLLPALALITHGCCEFTTCVPCAPTISITPLDASTGELLQRGIMTLETESCDNVEWSGERFELECELDASHWIRISALGYEDYAVEFVVPSTEGTRSCCACGYSPVFHDAMFELVGSDSG